MLIHCSCLKSSVLFPLLPLVFQIGALYFRVPRRVQIFGIASEGTPQQLNYLVDEDQTIVQTGLKRTVLMQLSACSTIIWRTISLNRVLLHTLMMIHKNMKIHLTVESNQRHSLYLYVLLYNNIFSRSSNFNNDLKMVLTGQ